MRLRNTKQISHFKTFPDASIKKKDGQRKTLTIYMIGDLGGLEYGPPKFEVGEGPRVGPTSPKYL